MNSFVFSTAKSLISEVGGIRDLANICINLGVTNPLIITDPGIVSLGLHKSATKSLRLENITYGLFSDVCADPDEVVVNAARKYAVETHVDGIVGLGGGSSMDVAKLVAVLAKGNQSLNDIYGVDNIKNDRLPLILVPTTAGTGSEVTPVSIVTVSEQEKKGVVSPVIIPDVALLDAGLTVGLPPYVTAATGIDAMVHAIEAYTSIHKKNPYSDMLAREALKLLSRNIHTAVHHGSDLNARNAMLYGAMLAGQAFANAPVAAVHALAYPLGSYYHIPHGLSNSLVLPHVMRFNSDVASDLYAELMPCILRDSDSLNGTNVEKTNILIEYLVDLIHSLGLPSTLESLNVEAHKLPMLAEASMRQERLLINNPKKMQISDALKIYQAAF